MHKFASLHRAAHVDGNDVVGRLLSTCEEMLVDRGCTNVVRASGFSPAITSDQLDVHVTEEKVGVKLARQILDAGKPAVVVSPEGATPFTKRECEGKPIQFLLARDMCVNVTKHHLVPKHEVVAADEVPTQTGTLPKILTSDPVVQWYDWPVGTVVRVWRCFGGHEPVPYYRVVCAA
jgi:DNA-directed RNA polymerase subunit H (RpoH/RPB5)